VDVSLDHFTSADFEHIYEPREDSFLLLDALKKDLPFIKQLQPDFCVEIGSGSGLSISFLSKELGTSVNCIATDINPEAAYATSRTSNRNNGSVQPIITKYIEGTRLGGLVDVLIFNPPYVPTPSEEIGVLPLPASWAGGVNGMEVLTPVLESLDNILSQKGVFYVILEEANQPKSVAVSMMEKGFLPTVVAERRAHNEHLFVVKFSRRKAKR